MIHMIHMHVHFAYSVTIFKKEMKENKTQKYDIKFFFRIQNIFLLNRNITNIK